MRTRPASRRRLRFTLHDYHRIARRSLSRSHSRLEFRSVLRRHVCTRLHRTNSHQVPARASQTSLARATRLGSTRPRCIVSTRWHLCPLNPVGVTSLHEIIGALLYYPTHTVDSILVVAIGTLASAQAQGIEATPSFATTSDMCLRIHSDAFSPSAKPNRALPAIILSHMHDPCTMTLYFRRERLN